MNSMNRVYRTELDMWFEILMNEWSAELSPERKPYLWNKMLFASLEASARSFIYYLEAPNRRAGALVQADAYRSFAQSFDQEDVDWEQVALAIADRNIGYMDESCAPERPDWIPEEDWVEAQHAATHDEDGKLLRPQLLGFLTGAKYDIPVVEESEFDTDNAMKVVRACIHQALKKCQQDYTFCLRKAAKPNSNYWQNVWNVKTFDAKMDKDTTELFIKQHSLEYENS